jgi:hypothetical protein
MKNITSIILTVAVTFVVSAALNFTVQYLTFEHGAVTIGPTLNVAGKLHVPVDVFNYTSQALDKLRLSIPSAITLNSLVASRPVHIEPANDVVGMHSQTRIFVSGLEAKQLTRLLIPIANEADARLVELLNGPELNVKMTSSSNVSNPALLALRDAVVTAALASLLYAFVIGWAYNRTVQVQEEIKEIRAQLDKTHEMAAMESRHLRAELDTARNSLSRLKVLLLARLADYAKELGFWRNTMAKLVLATGGNKQDAEAMNKQVTDSLKTFGTRGRAADDFEAIQALAGMLQRAEGVKSLDDHKV